MTSGGDPASGGGIGIFIRGEICGVLSLVVPISSEKSGVCSWCSFETLGKVLGGGGNRAGALITEEDIDR